MRGPLRTLAMGKGRRRQIILCKRDQTNTSVIPRASSGTACLIACRLQSCAGSQSNYSATELRQPYPGRTCARTLLDIVVIYPSVNMTSEIGVR